MVLQPLLNLRLHLDVRVEVGVQTDELLRLDLCSRLPFPLPTPGLRVVLGFLIQSHNPQLLTK